jgi:hypothetical protein
MKDGKMIMVKDGDMMPMNGGVSIFHLAAFLPVACRSISGCPCD